MHCLDVLRELVAFDTWANRRAATVLAQNPNERAERLFDHLLNAQEIWLARIAEDKDFVPDPWPENTPHKDGFGTRVESNHDALIKLIGHTSTDDLEHPVVYHNTKGASFSTPLREILLHLMHHGTHHRGQIALLLREAGVETPGLDFVFFVRERRGAAS